MLRCGIFCLLDGNLFGFLESFWRKVAFLLLCASFVGEVGKKQFNVADGWIFALSFNYFTTVVFFW